MTLEQFLVTLLQATPLVLIKLFAVILLLLHLSFSFVLVKQIKVMTRVVEAQISPALYTVAIVHFLSSLFILVWAMIFL